MTRRLARAATRQSNDEEDGNRPEATQQSNDEEDGNTGRRMATQQSAEGEGTTIGGRLYKYKYSTTQLSRGYGNRPRVEGTPIGRGRG